MADEISSLIERMRRRERARKFAGKNRLAEQNEAAGDYVHRVAIERVVALYLSQDCDPTVLTSYLTKEPVNFSELIEQLPDGVLCEDCYEITPTSNPYLDAFLNVPELSDKHILYVRLALVQVFAFAIPNEQALSKIAEYGPVLEVGAGTGYWAALLRSRGIDVIAVDLYPVEARSGSALFKRTFTTVLEADEGVVRQYPERTLLLTWPPGYNPMPQRALEFYRGSHVIYIGEGEFGCTADEPFHRLLERDWKLIDSLDIPHWKKSNDWLQVYERK
jgi:hypothetical protein